MKVGEEAALLTLWLLWSLLRSYIILLRNEVTFLALMRLLFYGRGCLLGLTSIERKNLHLDSRLPRTDLLGL